MCESIVWPRVIYALHLIIQSIPKDFPFIFAFDDFSPFLQLHPFQRPSIQSHYLFPIIIIISRIKQLNHDTKLTFSLHLYIELTTIYALFTHKFHWNWWSHIESETQFLRIKHHWEQPADSATHTHTHTSTQHFSWHARDPLFSAPHKIVKYHGKYVGILSSRELCIFRHSFVIFVH